MSRRDLRSSPEQGLTMQNRAKHAQNLAENTRLSWFFPSHRLTTLRMRSYQTEIEDRNPQVKDADLESWPAAVPP